MTTLKTANILYGGGSWNGSAGSRQAAQQIQHRVLSEAAQMIIEAAAISCDDADSPAAAGFIASLECILATDERPAQELVAEAIRDQRRRNNASV